MLREFSDSLSGEVLSYAKIQNDLLSQGTFFASCHHSAAAALRKVLRSHLPAEFQVSRGFIFSQENCSALQEIIIHHQEDVPAFAEGDLVFLTPRQAKVVVGIYETPSSERELMRVIQATAQVGEFMKQSGKAQGLVAHWLPSPASLSQLIGFKNWVQVIANRNIPAFFAWGNTYCFCRHISCEPARYAWGASSSLSHEASPALASLLSLIWYHLLQPHKSSPFKEWFAEDRWKMVETEDHPAVEVAGAEKLVSMMENGTQTAPSTQKQYVGVLLRHLLQLKRHPSKRGQKRKRGEIGKNGGDLQRPSEK